MGEITDMILEGLMSEDGEYIGPEPDKNGIVHLPDAPSKSAKRRAQRKRQRQRSRDKAEGV